MTHIQKPELRGRVSLLEKKTSPGEILEKKKLVRKRTTALRGKGRGYTSFLGSLLTRGKEVGLRRVSKRNERPDVREKKEKGLHRIPPVVTEKGGIGERIRTIPTRG